MQIFTAKFTQDQYDALPSATYFNTFITLHDMLGANEVAAEVDVDAAERSESHTSLKNLSKCV